MNNSDSSFWIKKIVYIPKLGEVIQYRTIDDNWEIRVGDGKTSAQDLPHLYDIYERVILLEKQIKQLQERINHE